MVWVGRQDQRRLLVDASRAKVLCLCPGWRRSFSDRAPSVSCRCHTLQSNICSIKLEEQLEGVAPGPDLATILSRIDVSELSGYDRVVVLQAHRKMASHHAAYAYQAMASISDVMHEVDTDYELAHRAAAAEIRAGLSLTRRAADAELDLALDLVHRLPRVWRALAAGDIDVPKARVIVTGTTHLSNRHRSRSGRSDHRRPPTLTTGQLRVRIARLCISADPDDARQRYETAVEERRLVLEADPDGTAHLTGYDLPADRAMAVSRKINRLARQLGDPP